jgi:ubiquinone biosynthesis protein
VFRALATMEGTPIQLAPGFDIVAEARRFAAGQLTAQFSPDVLRRTAADELIALLPVLGRLPRRIDRRRGGRQRQGSLRAQRNASMRESVTERRAVSANLRG